MRVISWKCFVLGKPSARMPKACLDSCIDESDECIPATLSGPQTNLEMSIEIFPTAQVSTLTE